MGAMFCTVEEAAERLETTEAEVLMMLREGILREFRDGRDRFLRIAELETLLVGQAVAAGHTEPVGVGSPTVQPQTASDVPVSAACCMEIKLPRAPAVRARTARAGVSTAAGKPESPRPVTTPSQPAPTTLPQNTCVRPESTPPSTVPTPTPRARRPKLQTHEMSLGQWIWTGLIDDRPQTILALLALVLAGASAVASLVYLAMRRF